MEHGISLISTRHVQQNGFSARSRGFSPVPPNLSVVLDEDCQH